MPAYVEQHVISKLILRAFGTGPQRLLTRYTFEWGNSKQLGPGALGKRRKFVKVQAELLEHIWGVVESRAQPALAKVYAEQELNDHDIDMIRDLLALHWARSERIYRQSLQVWQETKADRMMKAWANPKMLAQHFYTRWRLVPAGPQALEIALRDLFDGVEDRLDLDAHFARRVLQYFQLARDKFHETPLEIIKPAPGTEFLLGDSPCLGLKNGGWAALNDIDMLFMPLGPQLGASLGPQHLFIDLRPEQVRAVNGMQVTNAFESVMYRTGAFTNAEIAQMRVGIPTIV